MEPATLAAVPTVASPTPSSHPEFPDAAADLDDLAPFKGLVDCPRGPHPNLVRKVSALAAMGQQKFVLPAEPRQPGTTWGIVSGGSVLVWGLIGLAAIGQSSGRIIAQGTGPSGLLVGFLGVAIGFLVAIVAPIALVVVWKIVSHGRRQRAWEGEHLEWTEARKRWERAYFCTKDDIMFVPTEDGWAILDAVG
ncbi:MAG: hypothetical protein HY263_01070 [Chloroflexi bacterium]|nr:hypothetical protein [Chloroflexota bacterium]